MAEEQEQEENKRIRPRERAGGQKNVQEVHKVHEVHSRSNVLNIWDKNAI